MDRALLCIAPFLTFIGCWLLWDAFHARNLQTQRECAIAGVAAFGIAILPLVIW